ncbi:MAG: DUF1566 domain-containing protein [Candidatus Wallbacteria bacterium]|nr:DUF1566 domain-containing protein [Candidatus Wallbacteria bacterium]
MGNKTNFKLPDTGLIKCFDKNGQEISAPLHGEDMYGQNGCFSFNPMSYTKFRTDLKPVPEESCWDEGYRMVQDNNTGLIWEVKSPNPGDLNYCDDRYTWSDAQDVYLAKLNAQKYGGFADWRIPNKDELRSIVDYGKLNPSVDLKYFPDCQVAFYWCAEDYQMQPYFGWGIFFGLGSGIAYSKKVPRHVRAVRGGFSGMFGKPQLTRFKDNGDGTITDMATNLMWQQGENQRTNWYDALEKCRKMDLAGYTDWRMPNIKELNTILNLTYKDDWWYYKDFFPAAGLVPPLLHYFSSTLHEKTYVWVTNFCFGYDGYYAGKNAPLLFRAVRNIEKKAEPLKIFKFTDSGQTKCYDDEGNLIPAPVKGQPFFGQDGNFRLNPASYTKLKENAEAVDDNTTFENGFCMVRDNNTGLIWEIKSPDPDQINFHADLYTFAEAGKFICELNRCNYGGFSDWRLPNLGELRTIVNYDDIVPAIDRKYFPDCHPSFYWSKEDYLPDAKMGWGIYFAYGCAICYLKDTPYSVRAVRGGYNRAFGDIGKYSFKDNGDGTISDLNAGLMWKKDESQELTFVEALKYCEELRLADYSDWRLPSIREIATLINLSYKDGNWFDKEMFPQVKTKPLGFYMASTTYGASFGWGVNFQFGYDGYYASKKTGRYNFRPVRTIKE